MHLNRSRSKSLAVSLMMSTVSLFATSDAQATTPTFYVGVTNGVDAVGYGTSATKPFKTIAYAMGQIETIEGTAAAILDVEGGTYNLTTPISLTNANDANKTIQQLGAQVPILDGTNSGGTEAVGAIYTNAASGITIHGLTIQNFSQYGIHSQYGSNFLIESNKFNNIGVSGSVGNAVYLIAATNSTVTKNTINNTTSFGINIQSNTGQVSSGIVISYNTVSNACSGFTDCGSIYINDRSHTSNNPQNAAMGNVIEWNVISNTNNADAFGVYLDDEASYVKVLNNNIYGTNQAAFEIHGGNNNTFEHNIFDLTMMNKQLALYQDEIDPSPNGGTFPNLGMAGNLVTDNVIYSSTVPPAPPNNYLWSVLDSNNLPIKLPTVKTNLYYDPNGTLAATSDPQIDDSNPTVADPLFVNAAANNYMFQSGSPAVTTFGFKATQ